MVGDELALELWSPSTNWPSVPPCFAACSPASFGSFSDFSEPVSAVSPRGREIDLYIYIHIYAGFLRDSRQALVHYAYISVEFVPRSAPLLASSMVGLVGLGLLVVQEPHRGSVEVAGGGFVFFNLPAYPLVEAFRFVK